jgi:enoyl-CoA hydratase/carnithine racemase
MADGNSTKRYGDVAVEIGDDYVATVELCRPPDNYFDTALVAGIGEALHDLAKDDRTRAVVLCAQGKHFCAGAALGRREENPTGRHLYDEAANIFAAPLPIVAAIQGAAIGGGLGLALAADFRVAAPEARFSANFARLGFHHGFATTVTLPAIIGQQKAWEMLYTGRRVPGEEAVAMGLADRLAPLEDVRAEAHRFAAEIAASGPLAVRSIRETVRRGLVDKIIAATDREKSEQDRLRRTADFAEGVKATAERRPPNFPGR